MLCSKLKQIILSKSTLYNNVQFHCLITSRVTLKKWVLFDKLVDCVVKKELVMMSPLRFILRDFRVWSGWTRNSIVHSVRRYRRDRGVREVIQCFKQTFFRPKRTLLISATAAYKARGDDDEVPPCDKSISDEELQALLKELEAVEMLSRCTLFCLNCGKRRVIDKKQPGVRYCVCQLAKTSPNPDDESDGWVPYMETEDVIIWRKEYKPGLGLYAYKVYGRYPEVRASDFAAIQMDGSYRGVWDAALASLAVVEQGANGFADQTVLHWEVLWPRLFANRDYVYIRRHKEFEVTDTGIRHQEGLFQPSAPEEERSEPIYAERPSVHSNAKRKAMEASNVGRDQITTDNKLFVILGRSCVHPRVPETKHAIRVYEYWSHMVIKSMNGPDKSGMEFVLTYYDEPSVDGMPSGVASWATGRAAPAYLLRMRRAASEYRAWCDAQQDVTETVAVAEKMSNEEQEEQKQEAEITHVSEQDMESSQSGPELEHGDTVTRDKSTQTEDAQDKVKDKPAPKVNDVTHIMKEKDIAVKHEPSSEGDAPKLTEDEEPKHGCTCVLAPGYGSPDEIKECCEENSENYIEDNSAVDQT